MPIVSEDIAVTLHVWRPKPIPCGAIKNSPAGCQAATASHARIRYSPCHWRSGGTHTRRRERDPAS